MRLVIKIIFLYIIFSSCHSRDDLPVEDQISISDTLDFDTFDEFIFMNFQNKEMIFNEDYRYFLEENLGVELISRSSSGEVVLYSLHMWGVVEDIDSNIIRRLGMNIKRFTGEGFYKTGTGADNNCSLFDFGISWHSHYDSKQEGFIEITTWDGKYIEGNYSIYIFNANDNLRSEKIRGHFRLKTEH
ncbi:MAG: hypothetical protein KJO51_02590 [Gramella sp.]|nr:hypothetical protein [Christiangramia sp.]